MERLRDAREEIDGLVVVVRDRKLYVRASADSWKAKHIQLNPRVALNVTIPKRVPFMPWIKIPSATIAFNATARVIDAEDADPGVTGALARAIPDHSELSAPTCIIEIEPTGHFLTFGVGVSLLAMRDPKSARGRVTITEN